MTSFISEKNLWTHGKLEVLMHGKSILWDVTKYAVHICVKNKIKAIQHLNVFCCKVLLKIHYACV